MSHIKKKDYQLLHVNFGGYYLFPNLRSQFNNQTIKLAAICEKFVIFGPGCLLLLSIRAFNWSAAGLGSEGGGGRLVFKNLKGFQVACNWQIIAQDVSLPNFQVEKKREKTGNTWVAFDYGVFQWDLHLNFTHNKAWLSYPFLTKYRVRM